MSQPRLAVASDCVHEQRREPRWRDLRVVLARLGGEEYAGATCDLSVTGMQVGLVGARPGPEAEVEITVAFEDELVTLRGSVVYARLQSWGCTFGVRFGDEGGVGLHYLHRRYSRGRES